MKYEEQNKRRDLIILVIVGRTAERCGAAAGFSTPSLDNLRMT